MQVLLDKWAALQKLQQNYDVVCNQAPNTSQQPQQQEQQNRLQSGDTWRKHSLQAYTLNSLALYHQQAGKPQTALANLRQAESLEQGHATHSDNHAATEQIGATPMQQHHHKQPPYHHPATTQLNLCAVLGSLKRHDQALACAEQALVLLGAYNDVTPPHPDLWDLIAVALYNRAAQLEHMVSLIVQSEQLTPAAPLSIYSQVHLE